jgi:predicted metal-dependent hydrolase
MTSLQSRPIQAASSADFTIVPRKVAFNWSSAPLHWIPGDPFSSHAVNEFSYLLVPGEFFFCQAFREALPLVTDDKLRVDVQAFIRQESIHARAHHESICDYLNPHGIDPEPVIQRGEWLFKELLAPKPFGYTVPKLLRKQWLIARVGIVAAVEHYTCGMGVFALRAKNWDYSGADPVVADLFRWHCAEEIEHRTVAFDLYRHLGGTLPTRAALMALVMPLLTYLYVSGTAHLIAQDRAMPREQSSPWRPGFWQAFFRGAQAGNAPSLPWFILHGIGFLRPGYNPINEASTEEALAYINSSPAVRAHQT